MIGFHDIGRVAEHAIAPAARSAHRRAPGFSELLLAGETRGVPFAGAKGIERRETPGAGRRTAGRAMTRHARTLVEKRSAPSDAGRSPLGAPPRHCAILRAGLRAREVSLNRGR